MYNQGSFDNASPIVIMSFTGNAPNKRLLVKLPGSTVNGEHVSATIAMATVVHTRF